MGPNEPPEPPSRPAPPARDVRETMFRVGSAYDYIAQLRPGIERDGLTLRWPDDERITELRAEPVEHHTPDCLVVRDLVTLTHQAPALEATPKLAAIVNRWATWSAVIRGDFHGSHTRLACKAEASLAILRRVSNDASCFCEEIRERAGDISRDTSVSHESLRG